MPGDDYDTNVELMTAAPTVKTVTAPLGMKAAEATVSVNIAATGTEVVTATVTEEAEVVVVVEAAAEAMTDVSAIDTVAARGTMMTIRDLLPILKLTGVVTSVHAKTNSLEEEEDTGTGAGMTVGSAVDVEEAAEEGEVDDPRMVVPEHLNGVRPPPKVQCLCRNAEGRRPGGMSMPRDTSSTLLFKQNKLVPPILGIAGLPPPMPVQSFGMGIGGNPNLSRQSRRLYIGSITPDVNEQNLADFFNSKMIEMSIGTGGPGNPVLAVQCNYEKNYAFVEFRSAEDATAAMAFDGIIFINGPLKIRRPKDYGGIDMSSSSPGVHVPGIVSTNVPDSINKVFVGGLPTYLNEEQVMELLKSFGELKAFNLVRENGNGPSKGYAFFEYADVNVTDVAIQSLNGMELGDRFLVVQRASVGAKPGMPGMIPNLPYDQFPELPRPIMPAGTDSTADARILLMLNMVTPDDLTDDQEYGDLYEDVKEECANFGEVEDLRIPRPVKKDKSKWAPGEGIAAQDAVRLDEAAGVGRVYVKYTHPSSAADALKSLAGRSFAGRSIIATLLSEDSQTTPPLNLIFAPQPDAPPPLPKD
ncbi:hypothetical protein DXG01_002311 [Tephrocybe rancida]|nr:hypothetical protein DXG01_002311 [Tephrocybe rancida]